MTTREANPWADRWERIANEHTLPGIHGDYEKMAMTREANEARDEDTFTCTKDGCELTAFYRPGVGGWWCADRHLNR